MEETSAEYKENIELNLLYLETRFAGNPNDGVASAVLFEDYRIFARDHVFYLADNFNAIRFGKTIMKKFIAGLKRIDGKNKKVYFGFSLPN